MKHPRNASREETEQLVQYMMGRAVCSEEDARNIVENNLNVAVFDDYHDNYTYRGRVMVVVGDSFVSEVFVWDEDGRLCSVDYQT